MGLLANLSDYVARSSNGSLALTVGYAFAAFVVVSIVLNVAQQLLFTNPNEPPVVFHWVPFFGNTIVYGIEPYKFFFNCREKYGDVFTFILLGRKTTVCLGTKGNEFVLNAKLKDVNAEEIYSPLTTPVFGTDVVYDCPNAKLMEQKKFVKFGLTAENLRSYVPLIVSEIEDFVKKSRFFKGQSGVSSITKAMAELTIYTASRSLQGKEVREKFDSSFADLYHDLDMGFSPINFMLPWAPLPHNRARDAAREKMAQTYTEIIQSRRQGEEAREKDMIWNLMDSVYKDGTPVPDKEVAHMMIALLMAGQHSSSSTSAWILLNLANRPEVLEELYEEQRRVMGADLPPLAFDDLQRLPLHAQVVKETLRIHTPIHSIMRKVKSPMPVPGTSMVIPPAQVLLASPGVSSRTESTFPRALYWEPHRWDKEGHALAPKITEGLDEDDEKIDYGYGLVSKGTNSPYLPFGAGRHRCIGEQFAYVQLGTILATFVRMFKLANPAGRSEIGPTDYSSLFSRPLASHADIAWEKRV